METAESKEKEAQLQLESARHELLPYIIQTLTTEDHFSDSFDNICQLIEQLLSVENRTCAFNDIPFAVHRTLVLGQRMGLLFYDGGVVRLASLADKKPPVITHNNNDSGLPRPEPITPLLSHTLVDMVLTTTESDVNESDGSLDDLAWNPSKLISFFSPEAATPPVDPTQSTEPEGAVSPLSIDPHKPKATDLPEPQVEMSLGPRLKSVRTRRPVRARQVTRRARRRAPLRYDKMRIRRQSLARLTRCRGKKVRRNRNGKVLKGIRGRAVVRRNRGKGFANRRGVKRVAKRGAARRWMQNRRKFNRAARLSMKKRMTPRRRG